MPPTMRIRPYKDFMTPLLHRRFARATSYLAIVCYIESLYLGGIHSWFWSWFPLGRPGVRAALIFIPAFMVFILRVSQLHVGSRTSFSAWDTVKNFPRSQVIQTVVWYLLSAMLFGEVYLWSAKKDADFGRVKTIQKTERPTLNEKPVYLTCYLLFLAIVQAGVHLYCDYDKIDTRVVKDTNQISSVQNSHQTGHPADGLLSRIPRMVFTSVGRAAIVTFFAPIAYVCPLYPMSIRSLSWALTRFWARLFYTLPKSGALPAIKPFHLSVLWSTFVAGVMLTFLWELGNAVFSLHVAQPPLKNERPITYESRDPNGSLLTGLRGKKVQTRAFAFWELALIAQQFEGRRRTVYEDIDRQDGSIWSQILAVSLDEIAGVNRRISDFEGSTVRISAQPQQLSAQDESRLPRLTQPLSSGIQAPGDVLRYTGGSGSGFAASMRAQNQNSGSSFSPRAKALFTQAENSLLSQEQQAAMQSEGFFGLIRENVVSFLKLSVGKPFRQEYQRRMTAITLGQPFGDVGVIVDAIDSLTRLAVYSLSEDKYGNVQRDVKTIIQAFTNAITGLERFQGTLATHWTDVNCQRKSPDADMMLYVLKSGLNELVLAFEEYSEDLNLSQSELRLAKHAAAGSPGVQEMQQAGR